MPLNSVFDRIAAVLTGKRQPAAAALDQLLGEARQHVAQCEARLSDLEARRPEIVVSGGEAGRLQLRASIAEAEADLLDARAAVAEIERRLADRQALEAEQGRQAAYARALARRKEVGERVLREYRLAATLIADLIHEIAAADAEIEKANGALPKNAEPLDSVERVFRVGKGIPARVLREEEVELWSLAGATEPLPAEQQAQVRVEMASGRGFIRAPGSIGPATYLVRKRFRRIETLEAVPGTMPAPLSSASLPAPIGGQTAIWEPSGFWMTPAAIENAARRLDEERRGKADAPERPKVTKYELLPDPATVTEGTIGAGVAA